MVFIFLMDGVFGKVAVQIRQARPGEVGTSTICLNDIFPTLAEMPGARLYEEDPGTMDGQFVILPAGFRLTRSSKVCVKEEPATGNEQGFDRKKQRGDVNKYKICMRPLKHPLSIIKDFQTQKKPH